MSTYKMDEIRGTQAKTHHQSLLHTHTRTHTLHNHNTSLVALSIEEFAEEFSLLTAGVALLITADIRLLICEDMCRVQNMMRRQEIKNYLS